MGDQLDEPAEQERQPAEQEISTEGGASVGGGVETRGGDFIGRDKFMLSGNVIVLSNLSPESLKQLGRMADFKTEAPPTEPAGIQGAQKVEDRESLQDSIDQALDVFEAADEQGAQAEELTTGVFKISKVDLLMKKAILLKSEAEEMLVDHVEQRKREWIQRGGQAQELDIDAIVAGYDVAPQRAKYREAYALLLEANELDPTHTGVLLHMAELLIDLTPEDPYDEEKILNRIKKLLNNPSDDVEKFRLAKTTFLLGSTRDQLDTELISQARELFASLGRSEWVRQCDDLIEAAMPQPDSAPAPPPVSPQPPQASSFNPVGRWNIQVMDAAGSVMYVEFYADGTFQSVQQAASMGLNVQGQGQWAFNPFNNGLEMQGFINNMQPFMLGIFIQGPQQNGFYGIGTDGIGYFFTRAQ